MTVLIKDCDLCQKPFPAEESWQNKCLVCWKEDKGYDLTKGDKAFIAMQAAYSDMRVALKSAEKRALRNRGVPDDKSGLSPGKIKVLLKLCHPDKHKNSEQATEVTKWLLAQRRKK